MEMLQTCFMVTGKEVQNGRNILPQNHHWKMEGVMHSVDPESVMKSPLTKQKILDVYADVFEGLGTFPGDPYKFKLKENHVSARHAPTKVPIHLQDDFSSRNQWSCQTRSVRESKTFHQMVELFCYS